MHQKIYNCEFCKQPVHISVWLYEIITKTDIQCKKVINITTALESYGHRQEIHCAVCYTVKTEQNLFLPRDITIQYKKYMDSQRKELKLVLVMGIHLNKKHC